MFRKLSAASLVMLFLTIQLFAGGTAKQNSDKITYGKIIADYLKLNQSTLKLTDQDLANWYLSDLTFNQKYGTAYAYVQQTVNGVKIFNAVSSVCIREGKVVSFAKRLYPNASGISNTIRPGISQFVAIQKASQHLGLTLLSDPKLISSDKSVNKYTFSPGGISRDNIKVELVLESVNNNLRLAWNVNIQQLDGSHWWNVRIDATTGNYITKNDWTVSCDFGDEPISSQATTTVPFRNASTTSTTAIGAYRVFPFPLEAPSFGASVLVPDPSDPIASPFGWHDDNGTTGAEYTITRGNNVYAYDDIANQDAPGSSPDGTSLLNFDFPANLSQPASTYTDASNVNLFYVNNMVHDYLYHYGFDEVSGNFQEFNYSGNGAGNDYVEAEAQDGGGTNNANFSTPDDGQNGRMQMYLWSGVAQSTLVINSPGGIAGTYTVVGAAFGPSITSSITQEIALVVDGTNPTSDACDPLVNGATITGKIALLDRGTCGFVEKVLQAQNENAVAVIVINNDNTSPFSMGDNGNGSSVTIPAVMISLADGNLIRAALGGSGVNGTLNAAPSAAVDLDGSFDNGIITHEFGHGVSNRLTGGPNNSNCLNNGEQGGEGWSDWLALMFTQEVGDAGANARGIGTFALGEPNNGPGIRRYPYSTDMGINPETYSLLAQSSQVHDVGEVWCTVLWDLNWSLRDLSGFDPDWINGTSGNNIAMALVIEGMKLQPCGPGFLDGRDAILQADDNLYGGIHKCLIWDVFARRGMGYLANQGSANTAGDETEDFSIPPFCQIPVAPPVAEFSANVTTTCFGIVRFTDLSTDIPQQWLWDFGDGSTSTIQNPTHTYTSAGTFTVTLTVTNTLGSDDNIKTSYITVTIDPAPTVTGNTGLCTPGTTTLTATVTSGNQAEWYDASNNLVSTALTYTTPLLGTSTIYTVRQITPTALQNVGPVGPSIGAGGYHNTSFEGKEYFTTTQPMRLVSVFVDANGATDRTFNLYSSTGTLLQTRTITVPDGQSRVTLNFDIQTPGNYQLGVSAGSLLYRNLSGASYPYTIAGLVTITTSNSTSNPATYYYYCYDWQVQVLPCTSAPATVNILVGSVVSNFTYAATGLDVAFTNTATGNIVVYSWAFGDGNTSSSANPNHTYTTDGTYVVSLHIETSDGCSADYSDTITVVDIGVNELKDESILISSKDNTITIRFDHLAKDVSIKIVDALGQILVNELNTKGTTYTRTLNSVATSFVFVSVQDGDKNVTKKVFINK